MSSATEQFWQDKKIFVTGHTGFKGGWLSLWLHSLGAKIHGYSLPPPTEPSFFKVAQVEKILSSHTIGDIRNFDQLRKAIDNVRPDIVFHLAAQPLVLQSYNDPLETYATNVLGTVHLFEAIRQTGHTRAIVNVTSDKCYENLNTGQSYRENDPMGGADPYSSSKACTELVTSAYRASFFTQSGIALASARAGNVIGGGDWAKNRLVPDFLRNLDGGTKLLVRSPKAIRPWQHVLEPLSGYLKLGENLHREGASFAQGWNFGPREESAQTVEWVLEYLSGKSSSTPWEKDLTATPHEAQLLMLDSSKAQRLLHWSPRWSLKQALDMTLDWHHAWRESKDMRAFSLGQIQRYQESKS